MHLVYDSLQKSIRTFTPLTWADRLAMPYSDIDLEVLSVTAIFHDIRDATSRSKKEHAIESSRIRTAYLEPSVWLEADLIDETGALGNLWDCMSQGPKSDLEQSYSQGDIPC